MPTITSINDNSHHEQSRTLKDQLYNRQLRKAIELGSSAKTIAGIIRAIRNDKSPVSVFQTQRKLVRSLAATHWPEEHLNRLQKRCKKEFSRLLKADRPHHLAWEISVKWTLDAKKALHKEADRAVSEIIRSVLDWPYRRSESSWAGGEHGIQVTLGDTPDAECSGYRVWSSNGKWSGQNSIAKLAITRRCFDLLGKNLTIGGLVTLDADEIEPRVFRAVWAEQGRGFSLKLVEGWIVRGFHSTADTLEKAKRAANNARKKIAEIELAKRITLDGVDLKTLFVRRSDSIKAGNCSAGTDSFIRTMKNLIGVAKEISAYTLLRMRDDYHVRLAIHMAQARRAVSAEFLADSQSDGPITS